MMKKNGFVQESLVAAIDEGTSSTRFMVFSTKTTEIIASHQIPITQCYPKEGWVEQDPMEILNAVLDTIEETANQLRRKNVDVARIAAVGITNQRETTILWDKFTGKPLHNAIVWMDTRTTETMDTLLAGKPNKSKDQLKNLCGLPISPYFSSLKFKWLLDASPDVKRAVNDGRCMFGTVDTWIIWNLTGGPNGGIHVTDVTNASCTMLMNIDTMQWDKSLCDFFQLPQGPLPKICSSSEIYGYISRTSLKGIPISGCLGDQQAALLGQQCFEPGHGKCTYGTGCFLLCSTGTQKVYSNHGLLTTVAFQLGKDAPPVYALEGSVAIAGAAFAWLKDNVNMVDDMNEIEQLANEVDDTNGVFFVPAFSGLYAPYWEPNARGLICGMTLYTNRNHIIRAAMEAICFQTRDILESMAKDTGFILRELQVDGGMTNNYLLMQMQADICGLRIVRQPISEITSLGAAMVAGSAKGIEVWDLKNVKIGRQIFKPRSSEEERNEKYLGWKMAVDRSIGWNIPKED